MLSALNMGMAAVVAAATMSSAATVSGTVLAGNTPVAGALVQLTDTNTEATRFVEAGADGRYSFSSLPDGLYWLTAVGTVGGTSWSGQTWVFVLGGLSVSQDIYLAPSFW